MTSRDFSPPAELERAEEAAQGANRLEREVFLHLSPHRQLGVEEIECLLREIAELERRAEAHVAGVGRQRAGDHLQQRRLSGAVLSHHAPALAAADVKVEAVVDAAAAE